MSKIDHFLISPSEKPEENLANLFKLHPNDYRQLIKGLVAPKKVYRIAFVGNQGIGKSSLINYIFSVWIQQSKVTLLAPIGSSERPGTLCFDGPYELFEPDALGPKRCVFEFYDGMGFRMKINDPQEDLKNKREIIQIARGEIKPGFVRYLKSGAFQPAEKPEFDGVDLFVLVANYEKDEDIKNLLTMKANLDDNFIASYIVLTHAAADSHPLLKNFAHTCIETPTVKSPADKITKVVDLLMEMALLIEVRHDVVKNQDIKYKMQDFQERFFYQGLSFKQMLPWLIALLVILYGLFFK